MKTFDSLLEGWMLDEENGEKKEDFPWKVSEEDVILLKEKVWHNKTLVFVLIIFLYLTKLYCYIMIVFKV